jgi:hypothetical protein
MDGAGFERLERDADTKLNNMLFLSLERLQLYHAGSLASIGNLHDFHRSDLVNLYKPVAFIFRCFLLQSAGRNH